MLSELKKIEALPEEEQHTPCEQEYMERLCSLCQLCSPDIDKVQLYTYRSKRLQVYGSPEDFMILLDGVRVVEFLLGEPFNANEKLVNELTL